MRAALFLLVGCNQVFGLDVTTVKTDARPPCVAGTSFGAGVPVAIGGNYSVEAARFTKTKSVAYLSLCPADQPDPKPGCELYTSPYSPETEQFSAFSKMTSLSAPNAYDAYPTITNDNQHLLFGSSRSGSVHIYVAATQNGSFDAPVITRLAGEPGVSNEPYIVGDGRVLYFSSEKATTQLYRMEGDPPAFGGAPRLVSGTDIPGIEELAPVLTDDELEIVFAAGQNFVLDLYAATRSSASDPFGTPARIAELSTAGNDWPVWFAPDGCELFYISKQGAIATLYVAKR